MNIKKIFTNNKHVIFTFSDLHLNGRELYIYGKKVSWRVFFRRIFSQMKQCKLLIICGDWGDQQDIISAELAAKQRTTFFEELEKANLRTKTVFLKGNHDHRSELFVWKKPVIVREEIAITLANGQSIFFFHGDQKGIKPKSGYRSIKNHFLEQIIAGKKVGPNDYLVFGHFHEKGGYNRDCRVLRLPSVKDYYDQQRSRYYNWLGYIGIGSSLGSSVCQVGLTNPY